MWPFSGAQTTSSPSVFTAYWGKVQNYINDLRTHDKKILEVRQKAILLYRENLKTNPKQAAIYKDIFEKTFDQMVVWLRVKSYLDTFLPSWISASKTVNIAGLGAIPLIVLGAVSIAALAYVTTYGLQLLREYAVQVKVLNQLEAQVISSDQAADLLESAIKTPTLFTALGAKAGAPIGIILGISAVAIGVYFLAPKLIKSKLTKIM